MIEQKTFLGIFFGIFFPLFSRKETSLKSIAKASAASLSPRGLSLSISRNDPPPRGVGDGPHAHRRVPDLADGVGLAERPHRRARAARRDLRRQEEGHAGIIQALEAGHGGEVRAEKWGRRQFHGLIGGEIGEIVFYFCRVPCLNRFARPSR